MIRMVDARTLPPMDGDRGSLAIVACRHCNTQLGNIVRGQEEPQGFQADYRYQQMELSPALAALGIRSQFRINRRVATNWRLGRPGLPGRRSKMNADREIQRPSVGAVVMPCAVPCRTCPTLNRVHGIDDALTPHADAIE